MQCDNLPVLLLTGYLGSGKTTLLNRILCNRKGIRFAVIVNDIGEVNIDATLIQKGGVVAQQDDNLIALQNGCICCSLKMDLIQQLRDLCAANVFDYIVIEASGICEPAPIAQTIASYASMVPASSAPVPQLDALVSVVDALRLRDEFVEKLSDKSDTSDQSDLSQIVINQIEFCNVILLNKVSMVGEVEREHIRAIIRTIQPKAKIIDCDYCDVPFQEILDTNLFDFEQVATSATWIQKVEGDIEEVDDHHHHHHEHHHEHDEHCHCHEHEHHHDHDHECDDPHCCCHHHHNHGDEYGISTFVYYRREPMSLNRFDELKRIESLTALKAFSSSANRITLGNRS
jgi:G3E family GTPase